MRNLVKFFWSVILVLSLFACAQAVWVKPGASQQDFSRDQYACLQSSQQQVSGTRAQFDGSCNCMRQMPFSETQPNAQLYNSCMGSKGWSLQRQQR